MNNQSEQTTALSLRRTQVWYAVLVLIFTVCLVKAFYIQVLHHDQYKAAAQSDQFKEYEISASRGTIAAYDGDKQVPIVLNNELYTIYADPQLIKDEQKTIDTLVAVLGGDAEMYKKIVQNKDSRYGILRKQASEEQKNAVLAKKLPGIAAQAQEYRTYPQGLLASQVLGFVDGEGSGRYGVEEALNDTLKGKPGELKAVTDIKGVPLAASEDNIRRAPEQGKDIVLTIDIGMQKQTEMLLKQGLDAAKSTSGSAVILDPRTGAVKAMANYPTYNPTDYSQVEDASVFNNMASSDPLEVGSVMKPLTAAAALDMGVVQPNSTFFDARKVVIGDSTVSNIEEDGGARVKTVTDILDLSLNTGATWLLMQMGGGELNERGRVAWHTYLTDHYRFGSATGIEQGFEAAGRVPDPVDGYGLNITYANTSFGQAMTATMLQMAGAYGAMLNGGTYYKPYVVAATQDASGTEQKTKPKILAKNVVKPEVSQQVQGMLEHVVDTHTFARKFSDDYSVGGKTGTAQIANPAGGYYENDYNGTYVGFVGGDSAEYIIAVRVNQPKIPGYAGSRAAQPLFGSLAHMLIDNFNVTTKTR